MQSLKCVLTLVDLNAEPSEPMDVPVVQPLFFALFTAKRHEALSMLIPVVVTAVPPIHADVPVVT